MAANARPLASRLYLQDPRQQDEGMRFRQSHHPTGRRTQILAVETFHLILVAVDGVEVVGGEDEDEAEEGAEGAGTDWLLRDFKMICGYMLAR